ncbi:MAG: tetratricopeptide repeat protein, partial [Rhodospirillales bacterium]|nr:tetratricopeptide repeat protein [Rhodospirillales bacterium]
LYKDAGRFADAEKALQRALAAGRMRHGDDHPNVAATMGNLATVLEGQSRFSEAEDLYKKALAVYERLFGSSHALTAIGLNNLANVYADQSRTQDAAGLQQRVVAIQEKAAGPDSPEVARALNNLANSYRELGRRDEAIPLYERAQRIMQDKFGRDGGPVALAFGFGGGSNSVALGVAYAENLIANDIAAYAADADITVTGRMPVQSNGYSTLGARGSLPFAAAGMPMTLDASIGWQHTIGNTVPQAGLALSGIAFATNGVALQTDPAVLGLGLQAAIARNVGLGVRYGGQFGGRVQDNAVSGSLVVRF